MFKVGTGCKPMVPDSLSLEGKDFLDLILLHDPSERPSASQLLDHTFTKVSQCLTCCTLFHLYKFQSPITCIIASIYVSYPVLPVHVSVTCCLYHSQYLPVIPALTFTCINYLSPESQPASTCLILSNLYMYQLSVICITASVYLLYPLLPLHVLITCHLYHSQNLRVLHYLTCTCISYLLSVSQCVSACFTLSYLYMYQLPVTCITASIYPVLPVHLSLSVSQPVSSCFNLSYLYMYQLPVLQPLVGSFCWSAITHLYKDVSLSCLSYLSMCQLPGLPLSQSLVGCFLLVSFTIPV